MSNSTRAKTNEGQQRAEIALLNYPGAQLASILGLTDILMLANRMARTKGVDSLMRVSHWTRDGENRLVCAFDTQPNSPHAPCFIIIPPSLEEPVAANLLETEVRWLLWAHGHGAILCSVCVGAFLLGETGLLSGRRATTHWAFVDAFRERFPDVVVTADKLLIDDGDIVSASGLMSWINLALWLVLRIFGQAIMSETARYLLVEPHAPELTFLGGFLPSLQYSDGAILKVQRWLLANGAKGVTSAEMAAIAGLEARTFLRRFVKATGMRPTEYCQRIRIGKAREMLEFTRKGIDEIAWDVGYNDTSAFSKLFQKQLGVSPGEYRSRIDKLPSERVLLNGQSSTQSMIATRTNSQSYTDLANLNCREIATLFLNRRGMKANTGTD